MFDIRIVKNIDENGDISYYIGEVYFDKNNNIYACTESDYFYESDSIEDLLGYIDYMHEAELKKIVEYNETTKEFKELEE